MAETPPPNATPKATVGPLFRSQMLALAKHAEDAEQAEIGKRQGRWYRPDNWEKSVLDIETMHEPFSRKEQEDAFLEAVTSDTPGTVGDLQIVALQGDWMHLMERAFRDRNASSVRCRLQAAGRKMAHAHEAGAIRLGLLGYIENLERLNKGEQA